MSIEVKQLIIKSNVKNNSEKKSSALVDEVDLSERLDEFRSDLLNQCRKIVMTQIKKSKER